MLFIYLLFLFLGAPISLLLTLLLFVFVVVVVVVVEEEGGGDEGVLEVFCVAILVLSLLSILLSLFVLLLERKFLAYAQRRMGPAIMGRNGAFQIALDLIKLLTKETFLIPRPSSMLAPIFLALLYVIQLMFSQNFI